MSNKTMTETDTDTAAEETPAVTLPGQQLRQAREASGLSIAEAAMKLHLHQRVVVALEAGDQEQLPSPIYVRGYLRNYARLVGIDPETVVAAYDGTDNQHPELKPPLKAPTQASSSDKPVKAVTYLITLGLVLLLLAWWQSRHISEENLIDLDSFNISDTGGARKPADESTAEDVPSETLGYPIKTVRHPDSPFYPLPTPGGETTTDGDITPAPAPADSTADAALPGDTATTPAELLETMPGMSTSETTAESDGNAAEPETASQPERGLQLELDAESWVEVYDASGKRLYLGLAKPGETIQVNGDAPLRVLLGYAPGVDVRYNGKAIDTVEHSQAGIAQFTVGQ